MDIITWPTYGIRQYEKRELLLGALKSLTEYHRMSCSKYNQLVNAIWNDVSLNTLEDLPYLPVRLFKHEEMLSVSREEVVKTMTSSGTSGGNLSRIPLDRQTSSTQVKVLSAIVGNFLGSRRLPMLVIDCRETVLHKQSVSARAAGVLGFSIFGRDVVYALDDDMSLNVERVNRFLYKHRGQPIFLFGFTSVVYSNFIKTLESAKIRLKLEDGILIHGGGWKKLEKSAVDVFSFKSRLLNVTGIGRVHNYYGMVEQAGSIFMECEKGQLHASAWSDIIIRDPVTFMPVSDGKVGLIQLLSIVPRSYPGHSLLSEDEGVVRGVDDCPCGRKGKYFSVLGRIENSEPRGCSDTYP